MSQVALAPARTAAPQRLCRHLVRAGIPGAAADRPAGASRRRGGQTVCAEPLRPDLTDPGSVAAAAHRATAWEDPFAGPLSAENRAFVEQSGKWAAFDVSAVGAFATFIGDVLASAEPVLGESGHPTGVILRTGGGGVLRVDVEADELFLNEVIPGRTIEDRERPEAPERYGFKPHRGLATARHVADERAPVI